MSETPNQDENRKTGFAYAAGITLFTTVAAFCGAGWFLDKWLGTAPWLLVVAIMIGSALGLYESVRLSSKTY